MHAPSNAASAAALLRRRPRRIAAAVRDPLRRWSRAALLAMLCAAGPATRAQVQEFSARMTEAHLESLYTRDVFDDSFLPAPFTSGDTLKPEAEIRFKGTTTRFYAKKSYRVRFSTSNLFRGQRRVNLNAMYSDKSFLREKLAWDLFADLGALAPDASHAGFSINGAPKGLFVLIPDVDRHFLELRGLPLGPIYDADDVQANADLTVRPDSLLRLYYRKELGDPSDYSDLADLIGALNGADSASFASVYRARFDTASVLRWFAVNTLTMMGDTYNKNYLLYRDSTRTSGQWTVVPWDYDLSWGRSGDLAIPYPSSLLNDRFAYTFSPLSGPSNALKDRFRATPELWNGFRTFLAGIVDSIFTEAQLWPRIDSLASFVRAVAEADPQRWGSMADFDDHVEGLRYFVTARRNFLLRRFIQPPSGTFNTATLPFAGEGVPHHFVAGDGRLLATLSFDSAAGLDSIRVNSFPASTPPGVPDPSSERFVKRRVEVIRYPAGARFTATLRWEYKDVSSTDTEVGAGVGDERLLRAHRFEGPGWVTVPGRVNAFANTVAIDSIDDSMTGAGRWFALLLSETYAATWTRVPNVYWERWHDVGFSDSLNGFIAGEHGAFLRTTDGGESWQRDSIGGAWHYFAAAAAPAAGVVAAGEGGELRASSDGGFTWQTAAGGPHALRAVAFSGSVGIAAGDSGAAFQSRDGGASWHPVSTWLADRFTAAAPAPPYFAAAGTGVRIFAEVGIPGPPGVGYFLERTWQTPRTVRSLALEGSTVWAAGDGGYAAFADIADTGLTDRSVPGAGRLHDIAAPGGGLLYTAGEGGAIHHSADGGLSWFRQLTGATQDLRAIAFTSSGRGFAVGDGGTILRTDLPGTLTGAADPPPGLPSAHRLHQNYPNPFNPSTTIAFDLAVGAVVALEIYDVLGRRVATPSEGFLPAGRHEAGWSASRAASGVYFYRLTVVDRSGSVLHSETKKLMVVR